VFLDELGEMPIALQAKLLRVLEQREVVRVGALKPRPIDVRFIAATNRDLEAEIGAGRFRQDLYFRLNGIALTLPPLRERVDEIEPLAKTFIAEACRRLSRPANVRLSEDAMRLMRSYQWPGNIRELRNVVERAVLLCSGPVITPEHLPVEKMGEVVSLPIPSRRAARRWIAGASAEEDAVGLRADVDGGGHLARRDVDDRHRAGALVGHVRRLAVGREGDGVRACAGGHLADAVIPGRLVEHHLARVGVGDP
jgi:transcriptional regulator with PAS, ATPase and Fis domain